MDPITDAQKAELRSLLSNPVLQQAFSQALWQMWEGLPPNITMETAALSHSVMVGAQGILHKLHEQADVRKTFVPSVRKQFRPETPIV